MKFTINQSQRKMDLIQCQDPIAILILPNIAQYIRSWLRKDYIEL